MPSALGKRKERDETEGDSSTHGSTLFVSNLPYTATSTDLQTLFSDFAPVRSAFVVLEQGTGVSKGVGYVSFAIKEDAQSTFETVAKKGVALDGRALRAQWADIKKHKIPGQTDGDDSSPKKTPKPRREPKAAGKAAGVPRDPLAIRTVVISGLPAGIDAKVLWKKLRKYPGAQSVDWPVAGVSGGEDPNVARALFATPNAAQDAVTKLHAHVFKGALLSVALKKRLDAVSHPAAVAYKSTHASSSTDASSIPAQSPTALPAPSRASRLIVRNLPWDVTELDLRAVFLPFGPIHSVHIPHAAAPAADDADAKREQEPGKAARPRMRGYAFVWMVSRKDAEQAVAGANGLKVRAGMAERMVGDKQKKKKVRRLEAKLSATGTEGKDGQEEEAEEEQGEAKEKEKEDAGERVIAVDWALSKEKWEEEKRKIEDEAEDDPDVDMAGSRSGSASEDDGGSSDDETDGEEHLGVHEDDGSGGEDNGATSQADGTPAKPTLPPPETGTTLFMRNVPYEATEDELRTLFRAFGPLRYARITIDPATGRGRGTGFACFWNKADADQALERSDILKAEMIGSTTSVPKKNPFKLPSLLTPDPSSMLAQSLVLHGRTLDLVRAVTRDEAGKLKEAGERAREKADKRNLYLLREGLILPNTPAAERLTSTEIDKRTQSFTARRALLRSNPSLFVSKTRLSVRQLPLFVTERGLKRLALHAVRAFEDEVKQGARRALTDDELFADAPGAEGADAEGTDAGRKPGFKSAKGKKGRYTAVKQAKIVHQMERVDAITGRGRSKGYGFVEMHAHADALRVLRWANNNPEAGPLLQEWWAAELKEMVETEEKKATRTTKGKGKDDEHTDDKDDGTRDEARLKRMRDELEKGAKKSRGTLIVEFSIENVQVIQRRAAKEKESKEAPANPRAPPKLALPKSDEREDKRPAKKARTKKETPTATADDPKEESGKRLGSLIGRKRRQRKMGAK